MKYMECERMKEEIKKQNHLSIDHIAFIGRTFDEYISIFNLDENRLKQGRILDCPSGPSSFAAEATRRGIGVTASDISYDQTVDELMTKGKEDIDHIYDKLDKVSHLYHWKYYRNKDDLISLRKRALNSFIRDFPFGYMEGRYKHVELPYLPFPDNHFSLVLSSHFLFLYSDWLERDFHIECLKEFVRVCSKEIRIYPLTGMDAKPYPYLDDILVSLKSCGIDVEITKIPFEFRKGSNKMMKIMCK